MSVSKQVWYGGSLWQVGSIYERSWHMSISGTAATRPGSRGCVVSSGERVALGADSRIRAVNARRLRVANGACTLLNGVRMTTLHVRECVIVDDSCSA
jgi:hypothetical protein